MAFSSATLPLMLFTSTILHFTGSVTQTLIFASGKKTCAMAVAALNRQAIQKLITMFFFAQPYKGQREPAFARLTHLPPTCSLACIQVSTNGTDYRVDWKLVPIPHIPGEGDRYKDDPKNQRLKERIKIAGDYGIAEGNVLAIRAEGQKGTGRGYGRRMGITSLNSVAVTSGETEIRQAAIGDTAVFTIASGELPENLYYVYVTDSEVIKGTKVDDINSEITAGRRRAGRNAATRRKLS
jgi:hypothetical protein